MRYLFRSMHWLCFVAMLLAASGCSRAKYRLQADRDAYCAIQERNRDPRWAAENIGIDMDPRSRYFETYNPDFSPLPPDDPTSHQYMQCVDGKRGWKHWYDNGQRVELENPIWQDTLPELAEVDDGGKLRLGIESALRLAYVHSPNHQRQLETLYLTSLDVTAERFRFDTQLFGGYDVFYDHRGELSPGGELNQLTVGRPNSGNPALQLRRRFATAGELVVGFANSFVFEFTGADTNLASSILNFTLMQPLLRGAGRDVELEDLTQVERNLLANLRGYAHYRQGLYTQVAIGDLGVNDVQRGRLSTNLRSFPGQGGVGGYLGLLQQLQQIRNAEANLILQSRTLAKLEAFLDKGIIGPVQVEQFRQNIQNDRDSLLRSRVSYELALDRYKTDTLGLPPHVEIELDESLINQFQLIPQSATEIQDSIYVLQRQLRRLPKLPSVNNLDLAISDLFALSEDMQRQLDSVRDDLQTMNEQMASRAQGLPDNLVAGLEQQRDGLVTSYQQRVAQFDEVISELEAIQSNLSDATSGDSRTALVRWIDDALAAFDQTVLLQASARLELVDVPPVDLNSQDAYHVALANRLDFMNGRAALVDTWRQIQVRADALQSFLNITASGDLRTARDNPVSFRAPTSSLRVGVEFDAPFRRLLERNAYRESLISYQRSRRDYIQSRDDLSLGIRQLLRQLDQLKASLEIQRQSVAIAITRVDLTQNQLNDPQPAGQFNRLSATTAINLLSAQASLRTSQNSFLSAWLDYMATRMRLYRELGVMSLDSEGSWIEYPLPGSELDRESDQLVPVLEALPPIPPNVSDEVIDLIDSVPILEDSTRLEAATVSWSQEPILLRLPE